MSICKEEFICAMRSVVSNEFSNIPLNENEIEISFSRYSELKMQKLIKSQRKIYWNYVNTASKKAAIVFVFVFALLCGMFNVESIRVSAKEAIEEIIIKTKNIFQIAYEKGIPLSEVDTEGNFKYTEFEREERGTQKSESTQAITGETFLDPKTNIYNKMLNLS